MPREGEKEEARDPHRKRGRAEETRQSAQSTRAQDLDEGDADGTKLYNEYRRGECFINGEDTY